MSRPFLPFALPNIGDEEIAEVVDTLKSGWVTTGPKAARFEAELSAFPGNSGLHAIAVNWAGCRWRWPFGALAGAAI